MNNRPLSRTDKGLFHFLYLFCSQWRWARRWIGGKWVRDKKDGYPWVHWNDSILEENFDWPLNPDQYLSEEYS